MTSETFEAFGLFDPLARSVRECGYTHPTPIQTAAVPPQLGGRDLLALAETGSGKTAAFLIPILSRFGQEPLEPAPRSVAALILAPTRELALQIGAEVAKLARHQPVRRAVVLGGVGKGGQIQALKRGVHILVATPGRLLDLVSERHVSLSGANVLVLDEADRMFDMGFIRDIRKIVAMLPTKRRTALFSATMPAEIRKLATEILTDPARIDLSPKQVVVDRIDQRVMFVGAPQKQGRLHTLLQDQAYSRVIVFTRTKRGADRVASRLAMAGIGAAAIHGNKAQNARQRALKDFSAGHVRVLVATDIAARGIDVSDISHVVNFDMPVEPETYVHRIGRTARKGTSGIAISLCDSSERAEIAAIERLMKQKIEVIADVGGEAPPMATVRNRPDHTANRSGRHPSNNPRRERGGRDGRSDHGRGEQRHGEHRQSPRAGGQALDAAGEHRELRERRHASHSGEPRAHRNHTQTRHARDGSPDRSRNPDKHRGQERTERHSADHNASPRNGHTHSQTRAHGHSHAHAVDGPAPGHAHERSEPTRHKRAGNGNARWNGQRPPKFLATASGRGGRSPAGRT